ncbi:hypothetical protein HYW67_02590 [Candidatus Parcubacteria bacterium]|nr:hypothetical protein [Candidatus Parcubacteria bacterium]
MPPAESPATPPAGEEPSAPGRGWLLGAAFLAALGVAAFWLLSSAFQKTVVPLGTTALPAREDTAGGVAITISPQNVALDAPEWEFLVTLDTHSGELAEDLVQAARLVDDQGNEYRPIDWTGDPPGGHHREGSLKFKAFAPRPKIIVLILRKVGGVAERRFTWVLDS